MRDIAFCSSLRDLLLYESGVIWSSHAFIAQLDRALPSEGKGQRFESSWMHSFLCSPINLCCNMSYLIFFLALCTCCILLSGVVLMSVGGALNSRYGVYLMSARVVAQFLTFICLVWVLFYRIKLS